MDESGSIRYNTPTGARGVQQIIPIIVDNKISRLNQTLRFLIHNIVITTSVMSQTMGHNNIYASDALFPAASKCQ